MYALVFALALALAGCSKDTPTSPAPKVNPGSDGVTSPPGLFPDPGEHPVQGLNTVGGPDQDKYDIAADVLWGSILKNEKKDMALVRALDGIRVLLSGVIEIDGKEQLYLGIDEETFAKHDIDNLRAVLETRFPDIPIYIEESEGIILQTGNESAEDTTVDIFSEDFSNFSAWTADDAWNTGTFTYQVPDEDAGNKVALVRSTDCTSTCTLTTKPIDLSGYDSATLSFHRWLDDALESGDKLTVEVGNNGTYYTVGSWDNSAGDDVWHHNTVTLSEQHLGEKTTIRITATLPSAFNLFDLFNSDTEARIIALDNVVIRGTGSAADTADLPNLTVYNVSVSPVSVDSGAQVKIRYNVRNSGTVRASKETVSFYRHNSATDTPETGGTQVSTFAMQSTLAPGGGFGRSTNIKTPSVSEDTVIHYYVCVSAAESETKTDDNCDHVTVTVKAKEVKTPEPETPVEEPVEETPAEENPVTTPAETPVEDSIVTTPDMPAEDYTETTYPKPPYESCYHSPERKHVMGGDVVLPKPLKGKIRDKTGVYNCGSITLAGIETKDGTRGFVMSGHVLTGGVYTRSSVANTDIVVGHGEYMETYDIGRLLGKVYKTSDVREQSNGEPVLVADAAFVAYPRPKTSGCSLTWRGSGETFCLDLGGNHVERAVPLKIRGKGKEVYTVVGSQKPSKGLDLWLTGAVSGVIEYSRMTTDRKLLDYRGDFTQKYHTAPIVSSVTIAGDSGAPIYTVPDADKNARIVGVHQGLVYVGDAQEGHRMFSSWDDTADALDLKPID